MPSSVISHLKEAQKVLERVMEDAVLLQQVESAGELMSNALRNGNKIISCGNGGSMCDAMHFAEELSGRYREDRPALAAISISDPSHLSCVGNDYGYAHVFARYVEALGRPGDVLLGISTSGNSENVIMAAEAARQKGMQVVALTGNTGGKIAPLAHIELRVPHNGYADRIQEVHIKFIHALIDHIEQHL